MKPSKELLKLAHQWEQIVDGYYQYQMASTDDKDKVSELRKELELQQEAIAVFQSEPELAYSVVQRMSSRAKRLIPRHTMKTIGELNGQLAWPDGDYRNAAGVDSRTRYWKAEAWLEAVATHYGIHSNQLEEHPDNMENADDTYLSVWNHNQAAMAYITNPLAAMNVLMNFLSREDIEVIPPTILVDLIAH